MAELIDILGNKEESLKNESLLIEAFFDDNISFKKNDYRDENHYNHAMENLISLLLVENLPDLISKKKLTYAHKDISAFQIPQFSDLTTALYKTPEVLKDTHENVEYEEMGKLLWKGNRKKGADLKWGENHAKTAALINLVSVEKGKINITDFGKVFLQLNPAQQALLIPILWLKSPLFHNYFFSENGEEVLNEDISILAESTQKRRLSNIRTIIDIIKKGYYLKENLSDEISKWKALIDDEIKGNLQKYLLAIRTKPFLLLAGISGTGKSRIVKQMAFDSCPKIPELRKDPTSPGNYCLIEVKPNWHDSTELLGYESKIGGDHYVLTPFVKFLAKAMLYPEVPFFVCLDEMNLAPVEQYFAEFLSVLESRTKIDGHIVSEPLIKNSIFSNSKYASDLKHDIFNIGIRERKDGGITIYDSELTPKEEEVYSELSKNGLRIPENVIIVGTVNMDETTHQFSRKVIDRAMTIEMNLPEGNPFMDFFEKNSELEYKDEWADASLYLPTEVKASDAIKNISEVRPEIIDDLKQNVSTFLTSLNKALDGTPFKVAYRAQNELVLYFYQLWLGNQEEDWGKLLQIAEDQILMMKVLPRIEGDEELLEEPIAKLKEFCLSYSNASKKVEEMSSRLEKSRFTSFWP